MNLYLISRNDNVGYDEYDSAVIAAPTEEAAKSFIVDGNEIRAWTRNNSVNTKDINISIKLIGTASPDIESGIVIESFNAG